MSEIYSQARVAYTLASGRRIRAVLVADGSSDTQEQGGGVHVWR
jgi:hypothetical protein